MVGILFISLHKIKLQDQVKIPPNGSLTGALGALQAEVWRHSPFLPPAVWQLGLERGCPSPGGDIESSKPLAHGFL